MRKSIVSGGQNGNKARFNAVRSRADKMGVRDINFSSSVHADSLECYEKTLDIIEKHKEKLDQNTSEDK